MRRNSLMLGAGVAAMAVLALAYTPVGAETQATGHEAAIEACSAVNPLQPVEVVAAVDDGTGVGFSLVWLTDKEGNLWMCDADVLGAVYSYTLVKDDLLDGTGPELIGFQYVDFSQENPQAVAEKVCVAYLEDGKVVASGPDGLDMDPGFLIFVEDGTGALHLCNATGDAMVWAFEPIGDPLDFDGQAIS